jgi:hypothetical protein
MGVGGLTSTYTYPGGGAGYWGVAVGGTGEGGADEPFAILDGIELLGGASVGVVLADGAVGVAAWHNPATDMFKVNM